MSKQSFDKENLAARMHQLESEHRLSVGELLGPRAVKQLYGKRGKPSSDWLVCGTMPPDVFHASGIGEGRAAQWGKVEVMPSSSNCAVLVATLQFESWRHHFCTPLVGIQASAWAEALRRGDPCVLRLGDGQQEGDGLLATMPLTADMREELGSLVLPLEGDPRERAIEFWSLTVQLASTGDSGSGAGRASASLVMPDELAAHVGQGVWGRSQRH